MTKLFGEGYLEVNQDRAAVERLAESRGWAMSQENVEQIRRGFELWNTAAGDPDEATRRGAMIEMVASYHPEAQIDFSRTLPDYPNGGVEAMTDWIESARGTFAEVLIRPMDVIDAGDAVVAAMRVTVVGALSGAAIEAEFFYVFRFSEGQVVAATTYTARRDALGAVGLAE